MILLKKSIVVTEATMITALAAAILANGNNRRDDWGPMAAMMSGGMNNWMNNPFAYLMFLALFRNGGFGFGGDGAGIATQGIETQAQLNAIRTQLQDNQNADCIKSAIQGNGFALSQLAQTLNIDFNTLQKCCCDVQAAIQQVAGQVGFSAERVINAVNMGDCNVIQALQNCCCQTQRQIADFRGDLFLQNCKDTAELNPMYKEKQETEQRFGKIEKSISGMEELMKKQQEMIEKFIKKFES